MAEASITSCALMRATGLLSAARDRRFCGVCTWTVDGGPVNLVRTMLGSYMVQLRYMWAFRSNTMEDGGQQIMLMKDETGS
jgi:hypothetical protein